ncbi:Thymocyte nuclear protein 1 [Cercospora beticola]|uniref:Thymocyte nuclear protein 1 n=1 Tax=Cercospora beticola TaxID=122368 RepID=A0A2G5I8J2_CERBT|nr:Thymocyte nuclear protein 1 [Cercospora beticola]PIB01105.1 Thymocyte nuclear protein 1 [Cercospora beticola]WPA97099.1 hypothetical protein RHO25_001707 [Cercospora beticola]
MPPKKKANKSSTARASTRANTVTSKRGKEYATTAAASRPTRAVAPPDLSFPDTAPERASNKTVAPPTVAGRKRGAPATRASAEPPKKRGRPAKETTTSAEPPKKRGRPAKETTASAPAKRGPGRPPKAVSAKKTTSAPALAPTPKSAGTSKKRGRPAKAVTSEEPPKKRGRPARVSEPAVPPEEEQPTPRKRGQAPCGGETTKIDTDDGAAADQLEDELEETVQAPPRRGRGRPPKAKGKQVAKEENQFDAKTAPPSSGRQYWLMKAEQDGHDEVLASGKVFNTKFTIDDLRSKTSPEPWDGVRNPSAAKNMREMQQGDLAFFYASGGKAPGIVGIMEIVREHELDATASDPDSYGYVADAKKRDKWCVVHVEFRKKLSKPVTRVQLVAAKDEGPLAKMQEFTAARLSVSKVSEDEWEYINSLIEGFEDEDEDLEQNGISSPPVNYLGEDINGTMPNTDSDPPLEEDDSLPTPLASSRPVSRSGRAGSAARLLAPPSRTSSRAGSVPRKLPGMGGRIKTPQPRAGSAQPPSTGGLMASVGEE